MMMDSVMHSFLEIANNNNGSPCILLTYRCLAHKPIQNALFSLDCLSSFSTNHRIILHSIKIHNNNNSINNNQCQHNSGNGAVMPMPMPVTISPLISLQINNSLLTTERLLGAVYDITNLCQIGNNSLVISFRDNLDPSGYEFIIQWIQITLMDDIIEKTKKLEKSLCLERIRESFLVDLNSDITDTCSLLSLIDEKTKERIKIPARGDKCIHISCFDLRTWLKQNQTNLALYCDLCHQALSLKDIIIDSYILDILENTAVSVKQVSITMDGTWHCINNSSLCNSDICPNSINRPKREKGKKKNQVDETKRESIEHWNEEIAKLVKLNIIKITENGTYNCLLCDTGGMTITTLMVSHVSGKKHLICQRNYTSSLSSDNRSSSSSSSDKIQHQRKKPFNSTCPDLTPHKKKRISKKNSHNTKISLPFIIPVLNKALITPISFMKKNTLAMENKECKPKMIMAQKELMEESDLMNISKPTEDMKWNHGESKFLWQDKSVEVSGFLSEESWGSNQSWVAQLEAQEKHLPD